MSPITFLSSCFVVAGTLAAQVRLIEDPAALPFFVGAPMHQQSAADFDGDGLVDVLTDAGLLRNLGNGRFDLVPLPAGLTGQFAIGDLDGDGDLDCVFVALLQNPLAEVIPCLNDGSGHFAVGVGLLPQSSTTYVSALAIGDVDGDGDQDIVVGTRGRSTPGPMQLLLNQNGAFVLATASLSATVEFGLAIRLADLDGDGDLDIVRTDVGRCRLLVNNGAGVFADLSAARLPALTGAMPMCIGVGDLDQDGDLDLALGGQELMVLQNNAGTFTDVTATTTLAGAISMTDVAIVDLDEDGQVDIAYAGFDPTSSTGAGTSGVLVQQNGLFLPNAALPAHLDLALSIAAADFDRDGDVDVVLGGTFANHVWVNARRHVLTAPTAHLGGAVAMQCHAAQSAGNLLFALGAAPSALAQPLAVPGLGLLALAPPIVTLRVQSVAGLGTVPVVVPVPNVAQLVGVVLHVQGAVIANGGAVGTGFTNHAVVVIAP